MLRRPFYRLSVQAMPRKIWRHRSVWLSAVVLVYVAVTVIMSSTNFGNLSVEKRFKFGDVDIEKTHDKLLHIVPKNIWSPMDLSVPGNQVIFTPINSKKKCFKFTEVQPDNIQETKIESFTLQRLQSFLHSISESLMNRISEYNGKEDLSELLSAEQLVELYRDSIDVALDDIQQTALVDPVSQCIFEGFNKNESEAMWRQAERRVRTRQVCRRYNNLPLLHEHQGQNLRVHQPTGIRVCAPQQIGPLDWHALVLKDIESDSQHVDRKKSDYLVNESMDERDKKFEMRSLEVNVTTEFKWQRPLTIIVSMHPMIRMVLAYEYGIRAGYREEDQVQWIKEIRGKNDSELIDELKTEFSKKISKVDNDGLLSKLFYVDHLRDKIDDEPKPEMMDASRLSFNEFAWVVIRDILLCTNDLECLRNIDPLWRPQHVQCSPCSLPYDVLSKMDTLLPDKELMTKLIGENKVTGRIFKENLKLEENYIFGGSTLNLNKPAEKFDDSGSVENTDAHLRKKMIEICEQKTISGNSELSYFEKELNQFRSKALHFLERISSKEYKFLHVSYAFDHSIFGYTGQDLFLKCSAYVNF